MSNLATTISGRPYPRGWERHDRMLDGTPVFVRPLKPEDGALYPEFFRSLTPEDLRLRFFAPLRELSQDMIERFTRLDYSRAMAFIAIDETDGKMLGVVRLHYDPGGKTAGEYAVNIRSGLKGKGLGWVLMRRIIEYARSEGLKEIHGEVLNENATMLQMCSELGFHVTDNPMERGVKRVTLNLDALEALDQMAGL
jgi:acetyltransferase